ncbi:MAG: alpha-ketoacid dehydrogenase subunit beta [Gemmatimonadetes bacterium]|nr:alpha-ketoacid dehydrogenase subunit beta [Gemmatimonadota bacterium]
MSERTMVEALRLALEQEMEADDSVLVLGEDVGVDGGVFRVTEGLLDAYGEARVMDTPLAESVIVGAALGMAIRGLKPVAEIQFSGFTYLAFHQLESHAARIRWRSRGRFTAPMVVRTPYGAGVRALEHHSESREAYWAHTPGLKTVIPSGPRSARALLVAAIRDPDPVVFYEPKAIYRAFREEVPDEEETLPIGQAAVAREGAEITLVTWGAMLKRTLDAAEVLADEDGVAAEVIDVRTVSPLDAETIAVSARKTGRVAVVHEAPRSFGPGAEVVARLVEKVFWWLEAPVKRITAPDVITPYFAREQAYLPAVERIVAGAREVLETEA